MSLKSRIREAQGEQSERGKPDPGGRGADKRVAAMVSSNEDGGDEIKEAVPSVEEIRALLLRKSTD